jgi:hypothetical protein
MCEENREEKEKGIQDGSLVRQVGPACRACYLQVGSNSQWQALSHGALAGVPRPARLLHSMEREVSGRLVLPGRIHCGSNPVEGWGLP